MAGGYSCKRESKRDNIIKVYGKWTIPYGYGGIYSDTNTAQNIVPSMFFGFVGNTGYNLDLGFHYAGGSQWKTFYSQCNEEWELVYDDKGPTFTVTPGQTVYVNAWVEDNSICLNVSGSNYESSELINGTYRVSLINDKFKDSYDHGYKILREIAIAANNEDYETSGCYMSGGVMDEHTLIAVNGQYYIWTDAESLDIEKYDHYKDYTTGIEYKCKYIHDSSNRSVLELRKDLADLTTAAEKRFTVVHNKNASAAFENVSISFAN